MKGTLLPPDLGGVGSTGVGHCNGFDGRGGEVGEVMLMAGEPTEVLVSWVLWRERRPISGESTEAEAGGSSGMLEKSTGNRSGSSCACPQRYSTLSDLSDPSMDSKMASFAVVSSSSLHTIELADDTDSCRLCFAALFGRALPLIESLRRLLPPSFVVLVCASTSC